MVIAAGAEDAMATEAAEDLAASAAAALAVAGLGETGEEQGIGNRD